MESDAGEGVKGHYMFAFREIIFVVIGEKGTTEIVGK